MKRQCDICGEETDQKPEWNGMVTCFNCACEAMEAADRAELETSEASGDDPA